jgi:hypothetical protein
MRKIVATLSLSVAVASRPHGGGGASQEEEADLTSSMPKRDSGRSAPRNEVYQEFLADKRPIGTTSWRQQMDREGPRRSRRTESRGWGH